MSPPIGATRSGIVGATTAIPDSVVMQYYATTWSQGDGTWADDVDPAQDISLTGDFQATTLSDGADAIDGDGADDHGTVTLPSEFEGSGLEAFSVEFTIEYTAGGDGICVFGLKNSGNTQRLSILLNFDESFNSDDGNLHFGLRDTNDDRILVSPSTNPGLDDGTRHDVSVVVEDATQSNITMYIDESSVGLSYNLQDNPSSFTTWDVDCGVFARNFEGSPGSYADIDLGADRWHDIAINSPTISAYP